MAYGLSEKQNLRFRLERIIGGIDTDVNSDIDPGFALFHYPVRFVLNHLSIGIKYQLIKNKSALYLPLSFTKPDAGNTTAMKLFEPTYIRTFSSENFEFNPSIKALIPMSSKVANFLIAINLGLASGRNLTKLAFRYEFGILFSPKHIKNAIPHISIGCSISP